MLYLPADRQEFSFLFHDLYCNTKGAISFTECLDMAALLNFKIAAFARTLVAIV